MLFSLGIVALLRTTKYLLPEFSHGVGKEFPYRPPLQSSRNLPIPPAIVPNRNRFLSSIAAAVFLLWLSDLQSPAGPEHVILISCDGLRPDAVELLGAKGAPHFYRLITEGSYTHNARTDADYTITLPNHTCMITGRGVKGGPGHGWVSNSTPKIGELLHRNKKAYLQSAFDVVHDHGLRTALFASKKKFVLYDLSYNERNGQADTEGADNGRDKINIYQLDELTDPLIIKFVMAMSREPFGFSMLHLRDCDSAGHGSGWDIANGTPYINAVVKVDRLIGHLLTLIEASPRLKEKTAMFVTADHGGRLSTKTHTKADEAKNYTIPFYVWGAGVHAGGDLYALNPGTRADPGEANPPHNAKSLPPVRNGDAGNLATFLLGLPPIKGSTINGKQNLKVAMPPPAK